MCTLALHDSHLFVVEVLPKLGISSPWCCVLFVDVVLQNTRVGTSEVMRSGPELG